MGAAATGPPLFPDGYVAGTITIPDSNPAQLLTLIQAQIAPNCPGAGQEVTLQATSGPLYVGRTNKIGDLSTTNYGYVLAAGESRTYRSGWQGFKSPIGDLMVLMTGGGTFSVEVT